MRKIFIHPRCKRLISQLASTTWNKARTSYERTTDGHGDLLDALVYLVRNVRQHRNPYPRGEGALDEFTNLIVSEQKQNTIDQKILDMFVQDEEETY